MPRSMNSTVHTSSLRASQLVPLIVACALFMENLDGTIITTALPAISRSLNEDPLRLSLAITAYLLSLAVFIPLSGWAADRYGARRIFSNAILLFTLGSALCGFARSMPELVAARVFQGIGGAMMVPVGRLVLLRKVPKRELVTAMSYLTVPALIGPIIGPPIGGVIVTYASWRWIFFINLPIGLIGWWLVTRYIEEIRSEERLPLDLPGWLLVGGGLATLVFGFESMGKGVVPASVVGLLFGIGAVLGALYVWYAGRRLHPIIDLSLLRIATFRASVTGGTLFRVGIGASTLLLPLMLQLGFGLSPVESGGLTFVSAIGALAMKTVASRIVHFFGFRTLMIGNALLATVYLLGYSQFGPATPHMIILAVLLLGGLVNSLQFTCFNTIAFADVDEARMSQATSFSSTVQQLSLSIGVGFASQLLNVALGLRHGRNLAASDFSFAYVAVAIVTGLSVWIFWRLPRNAGEGVSGHSTKAATVIQEARTP
jgi:EmrB/QacA subfamily drug resistance transporter